ncbi:type II toxin-antitoxin system CcdA family antitoxin [Mesorhizobium sp. YIM 152430]|jgi:antitoxin CcdA|uniref:type II toxin-antitoxin system CcdA family antitoxin n=1 Tax=Mesorhizobium sp. YIM 152430 TaxID=3031761 RepID=UPI0023DAAFED|nr:type II toxin-antitoxin system CcdA family antitoxin [Mesorhizobium sp. YIM 152430]MDF1600570.1 type II toxin-antitoxin system CcdA family antitoxin [Mesorhizobium sp. YIM 152430]
MLNRSPSRKSVNLSIDAQLLDEAKALKVNLSRAADAGLAQAISRRKAEVWLIENAKAIEENNRYFEQHGLPFSEYRGF